MQQVEEVYYHSEVPPQLYWLLLGVYLPLVTIGVVFNVGLLYVVLSTRDQAVDSDPFSPKYLEIPKIS